MNTKTAAYLSQMQGVTFEVRGPFLVANLSKKKKLYDSLSVGAHGEEFVDTHEKTKDHSHTFLSLYKSKGLNVMTEDNSIITLPNAALTLVPPGISHSWIAKQKRGSVSSVDTRHKKQDIQPLALA